MNEETIRQIVREEMDKNQDNGQFTVSRIPFHTHNGTDSQNVNQKNIIPCTTSLLGLNTFATETLTVELLQNITRIQLNGIAADNYGQAVTKKAVLNGYAQLGDCFRYNQTFVNSTYIKAIGAKETFLQTSDDMFIDTTDLVKTKVAASDAHFVYVTDGAGNVVAQVDIISWSNNSVTFQITLATFWQIFWYLSMY